MVFDGTMALEFFLEVHLRFIYNKLLFHFIYI